ncbi:hypothetical protein JTE90_010410 [Oedothorax gibbosus]|uniref:Uncharacterized protein n=1 Tax=Oedothorax gibbosus TaxID=931172 RepID=A0AAV6W2I5_9ARAC|nr:hypothetical protein JTE90_010410 [Oedothorax gibbosus]
MSNISDESRSCYAAVHLQCIGTQTNINNAEQRVSISTLQISPLTTSLNREEPLYGNLNCEVRLPSPQRKIESTLSCNALDEPAVLILNTDKATTTDETLALKETPQSPICRVHMTPFPTNLRTKYAKVVADNLSPEERWNLKRKLQKWSLKNNSKKQCVSMQSLFSSNPEKYSSEERKPKKAKLSFDNCDCYRDETILEEESPDMGSVGCYKNVMSRLKSKFMRRDSSFATYKTF